MASRMYSETMKPGDRGVIVAVALGNGDTLFEGSAVIKDREGDLIITSPPGQGTILRDPYIVVMADCDVVDRLEDTIPVSLQEAKDLAEAQTGRNYNEPPGE